MWKDRENIYKKFRDYAGYLLLLIIPASAITGILVTKEIVEKELFTEIHADAIAAFIIGLFAVHSYFGLRHKLVENNKWNLKTNILLMMAIGVVLLIVGGLEVLF